MILSKHPNIALHYKYSPATPLIKYDRRPKKTLVRKCANCNKSDARAHTQTTNFLDTNIFIDDAAANDKNPCSNRAHTATTQWLESECDLSFEINYAQTRATACLHAFLCAFVALFELELLLGMMLRWWV